MGGGGGGGGGGAVSDCNTVPFHVCVFCSCSLFVLFLMNASFILSDKFVVAYLFSK